MTKKCSFGGYELVVSLRKSKKNFVLAKFKLDKVIKAVGSFFEKAKKKITKKQKRLDT